MEAIDKELANAKGVYAFNGGAVTLSELIRRSKIGPKTLFGTKYKDGFKRTTVEPWLEKLKNAQIGSRRDVKKSLAKRLLDWRELYEDLLRSHRKSELDLQETQRELLDVSLKNTEQKAEIERLMDVLSRAAGGNVVRFDSKTNK